MIAGNKDYFAVEFEIDGISDGLLVFGRYCFWVEGKMLGNFHIETCLSDVLSQMTFSVKDCGKRQSHWTDWRAVDVFNYLSEILYEDMPENEKCEIEMPARYAIKMDVEVFRGIRMFLLDCDVLTSRFIYSRDGGGTVEEAKLVLGEFDSAIRRFYLELSRMCDECEIGENKI